MATITLILTDTPSAGVSIRSDFRPAVGHPITPAQAQALDLIASTHSRWGKPGAQPSQTTSLMSEHWGDPAP